MLPMRTATLDNTRMLATLQQWPNDWACDCPPKVRVFASGLRDLFRRFLRDQIQCPRSPSTIRRHRNELHTLGLPAGCLQLNHSRNGAASATTPLARVGSPATLQPCRSRCAR